LILSITVGGILRAINTVGAAHSFATGSYIMGTVLGLVVLVTIYLDEMDLDKPESP
jgi:hypothetical protein